MTMQERPRAWQEQYFWLIVFVLFLVGIFLISLRFRLTAETLKPFGEMSGAFGEALLIAGILAATVDQFVKFRLIREVISNVWQYLANHRVPVELSDYLHETLQETIVRRNLAIKYKLSREPSKQMRADIEISYQIENYGNREKVLELRISEEEHKKPVFEEISCISSDPQAIIPAGKPLKITSPDSGVKKAEVEGHESIVVQPLHAGLFYNVKFKYSLQGIRDSDSDTLSFNGPTVDLTVEAAVPPDISFITPKTNLAAGGTWIYKRVFGKNNTSTFAGFPKRTPHTLSERPAKVSQNPERNKIREVSR
jgi:hypothetical protein